MLLSCRQLARVYRYAEIHLSAAAAAAAVVSAEV